MVLLKNILTKQKGVSMNLGKVVLMLGLIFSSTGLHAKNVDCAEGIKLMQVYKEKRASLDKELVHIINEAGRAFIEFREEMRPYEGRAVHNAPNSFDFLRVTGENWLGYGQKYQGSVDTSAEELNDIISVFESCVK